jgi:hypothetical protein
METENRLVIVTNQLLHYHAHTVIRQRAIRSSQVAGEDALRERRGEARQRERQVRRSASSRFDEYKTRGDPSVSNTLLPDVVCGVCWVSAQPKPGC